MTKPTDTQKQPLGSWRAWYSVALEELQFAFTRVVANNQTAWWTPFETGDGDRVFVLHGLKDEEEAEHMGRVLAGYAPARPLPRALLLFLAGEPEAKEKYPYPLSKPRYWPDSAEETGAFAAEATLLQNISPAAPEVPLVRLYLFQLSHAQLSLGVEMTRNETFEYIGKHWDLGDRGVARRFHQEHQPDDKASARAGFTKETIDLADGSTATVVTSQKTNLSGLFHGNVHVASGTRSAMMFRANTLGQPQVLLRSVARYAHDTSSGRRGGSPRALTPRGGSSRAAHAPRTAPKRQPVRPESRNHKRPRSRQQGGSGEVSRSIFKDPTRRTLPPQSSEVFSDFEPGVRSTFWIEVPAQDIDELARQRIRAHCNGLTYTKQVKVRPKPGTEVLLTLARIPCDFDSTPGTTARHASRIIRGRRSEMLEPPRVLLRLATYDTLPFEASTDYGPHLTEPGTGARDLESAVLADGDLDPEKKILIQLYLQSISRVQAKSSEQRNGAKTAAWLVAHWERGDVGVAQALEQEPISSWNEKRQEPPTPRQQWWSPTTDLPEPTRSVAKPSAGGNPPTTDLREPTQATATPSGNAPSGEPTQAAVTREPTQAAVTPSAGGNAPTTDLREPTQAAVREPTQDLRESILKVFGGVR